jgi:hypothetical protein
MIHRIRMVKDSRDEIKPNSKTKLKRFKSKQIEDESILKSMLGKIKALMSLQK